MNGADEQTNTASRKGPCNMEHYLMEESKEDLVAWSGGVNGGTLYTEEHVIALVPRLPLG